MFNLTGSEIIFILLIALVVLGPEKLPGAIKRAMTTYQELRKMGDGFQSEFKSVIDEPLRELKETAGLIKDQADPKKVAEEAERAAAKAALKDSRSKEVVAEMHAAGERAQVADALSEAEAEQAWIDDMESSTAEPVDEWADPVDQTPMPAPSPPVPDVMAAPVWGSPAGAPEPPLAPPSFAGSVPPPPSLPADPTVTDEESAA